MITLIRSLSERLKHFYPSQEAIEIMERLFCRHLKIERAQLLALNKDEIGIDILRKVQEDMRWLFSYKPVQYIVGEEPFCHLNLKVKEGALIPRPETEEWVEWLTHEALPSNAKVLDVGTGSGCIALALKQAFPTAEVEGWDISEEALDVAKENVQRTGLSVQMRRIDILNLPQEERERKWDWIVSNPPYVCMREAEKMRDNVLLWEPKEAIFVEDEDPLLFYKALCDLALGTLKEGGRLLMEISEFRAEEVKQLVENKGFHFVEIRKDMCNKPRLLWAKLG